MASVPFAVQKAVVALIKPPLAALDPAVPVLDHVKAGQAYPFVQVARVIAQADNLVDERMQRLQVALAVYSDFRGQEQVLEIMAAIEEVLDGADLELDDGTASRCDLDRADTARDADGVTYTGTALYTVVIHH